VHRHIGLLDRVGLHPERILKDQKVRSGEKIGNVILASNTARYDSKMIFTGSGGIGTSIICKNRHRCALNRHMDSYSNEDRANVPSCNPFANMWNNVSSWSSMKYNCDTWKGWSADDLFSLID